MSSPADQRADPHTARPPVRAGSAVTGPPRATGAPAVPEPTQLGPIFALVWLFFLLEPLSAAARRLDERAGVVGLVATLGFAAAYLSLWLHRGRPSTQVLAAPPMRWGLTHVAVLVLLGASMIASLGETGLTAGVYVAVACVIVLPVRAATPVVVAIVVGIFALGAVEEWGSQVGTAFGAMAASVAVLGLRTLIARNADLVRAHDANAALAVENERSRFARDLHDILGHSLTVITVKAELAQRLLDVDADRARGEVADLERLSRDALKDVRRAVEGYRDLSLSGELVRARTALAAAQIAATVPTATDEVPSDLRELFAWTVREGVTNVIRHSAAAHCEVVLTPERAEVRDDGRGPTRPPGDLGGSGLLGLHERAASLGATVTTRTLDPGFALAVTRVG